MKSAFLVVAAFAAMGASGMDAQERAYLRQLAERPRCERREVVVAGGVTNVVETWRRGGYEWTQTNAARRIVGTVQRNTFEQMVAEARERAAALQSRMEQSVGRLKEWKADVEAKIVDPNYVLLRSLLMVERDALDAIIRELDGGR